VYIKAPLLKVNNWIFSPSKIWMKKSIIIKSISPGVHKFHSYTLVNSGLLVNIGFYLEIGGYNEKIKLDFADTVFIEKAKKKISHFELLPFVCVQDFSHNETNLDKAILRYSIYLADIRNCDGPGIKNRIGYGFVGLLHLAKLSWKFRTIKFILMAFKKEKQT